MSPALPWFPLVGAMIGVALAALDWVLAHFLALPVRDALLLIAAALVTGMLHLDGFVDSCDALLGSRSTEARLAILRDSRVGAYGALGAALLLLARYAALGELDGPLRAAALIAAPTLGRWGIVLALRRFPYARSEGVGASFRSTTGQQLVLATVATAVILAILALALDVPALPAILAINVLTLALIAVVALAVTLAFTRWASGRLGGGLTGDTYGAVNELIELAVLVLAPSLALLSAHIVGVVTPNLG
jgi:adenosylcobinamide-GDP ribazoletransferase